jgi:Carboxypeptidase regulatory-like domain/TonB-dependent Receptor Plug Domain
MCNRFAGGGGVGEQWFKLRVLSYVLLAVLLATPFGLHAQAISGTITGTVTDQTGAAVPGATITVINTGTNATATAKSDGQGNFTLAVLPVGTYEVHVTQGNFKEYVETGVQVNISTATAVKAVLQVGGASEKVTVSATAVSVQTTSAEVGEVVSGTQVRELPLNGENFVGLTQLSPGVSAAQGANFVGKGLDGGVNFSVNGNPYNYNLFLVDGVNNNDVGSGRTILVYPSVDTIAEFKMIRNSYGPEYGQAAGAVISISTRSGENQFHGGFFYAGRNAALDANDWFSNNAPNPTKAKEIRNDYGYNISGPAIKNKLFFWWNQEWNKEVQGSTFETCVPTLAESSGDFSGFGGNTDQCGGAIPKIPVSAQAPGNPQKIANPDAAGLLMASYYPAPTVSTPVGGNNWFGSPSNHLNWSEWNVRGDYDITSKHRATFRWTNDSWDNPWPNNPQPFWGESAFPTVGSSWSQPSRSVMAKLDSTLTSTLVNDFAFGFGQNRIITSLAGDKANIVPELQAAYPAAWPSSLKQKDEFFGAWGGFGPYGATSYASFWNIAPYGNHEDLYTLQDNLSKVHGNHTFKTGFFYSTNAKIESNGNGADRPSLPNGSIYTGPGSLGSIDANAQTGNALANVLLPGTGTNPQMFSGITENSIDGIAAVHWHDFEPYFGDSWKIRRNLTIDFGFRWSIYREPYGGTSGGNTNAAYNDGGNFPNQWANYSPSHWSAAEATANPSDACNGTLIVPGTTPCQNAVTLLAGLGVNLPLSNGTPGPNSALVEQNNHSIAPRVGIAWDVRGDGKTAVRIGAGQFFQREPVGLAERLANTAPFVIQANTNRALDAAPPLANPAVSPTAFKTTGGFIPNSWQWNVSVEQELARNTTLQMGYVGNIGEHLTSMWDSNAVPSANFLPATFTSGTAQNAYRPAFNFGQIGGFARGGHANYNSLQVLFRSQHGPSTFQAAYTWSHSIANVELDNSSGSFNQQATTDQANPGLDKGNTNINRPNIFVANEVLYLPKLQQYNKFVQQTLGGWEANSIFTMAEGSSLTIFTNGGVSGASVNGQTSGLSALVGTGYQGNLRPLVSGDSSCNTGRNGDQILNANHFTLNGYVLGTFPANLAHRGSCFGAPNTNFDGQLAKNWMVKEKYRIKFSMDFFNLFNHPNFNSANLEGSAYNPSASLYCGGADANHGTPCSATNNVVTGMVSGAADGHAVPVNIGSGFGQASAVAPGRTLQYSLKFTF